MAQPIEQLRKIRLQKLEKIRKLGINPYPARCFRKQTIAQALKMLGKEVAVAGRIMAIRGHGGIQFFDLRDESGKIQLVIKRDQLSAINNQLLTLLDIGDFVDAQGKVAKTEAGEISVWVENLHLLTKSIRPLPEKWRGIADQELIFRKRYLDLIVNPERKELFKRKAKFWDLNRQFMKNNGFLEVEVPILEHVTGGADARPFITHMNALDQDFFLRISTELYQKRLIGGGFEKIYTLGPNFRNEGFSEEHLPEYYQIEWYWAYADYRDNMELVREMFRYIARELYGKTKFTIGTHSFDLADEWEEIDYGQVIKEKFGVDIFKSSEREMLGAIKKSGVQLEGATNRSRLLDNLWKVVRKDIPGPAFLVNEPKFVSPLAKSKPDNSELTERFHVIIAGRELGNGYSELNDPVDQLERFREQQTAREKGDEEAQMMDMDFVEMLEYGMPPTGGYAHSERVFWTLEGVTAREATFFPAMRETLKKK
jgi:lysyl-tRNA synthetase class 2